jgi:photosystem II stability/assembly factor-like uncharacterized protein
MKRLLLLSLLLGISLSARAQNWQRVFQVPNSTMSCAWFFNATEGCIGTGNYFGGAIATIYYTTDGGQSWTRAALPSTSIVGQVTDIYFRTPTDGWATLAESNISGWSGIYHSTDRGRSWKLLHQSAFPVGIRETSRGLFFTDRDVDQGVNYSSDGGKTWRNIVSLTACLGIDFYDDDHGLATSQAYGSPPSHISTTDGGVTWQKIPTSAECWSVLANPQTQSYLLASEQTNGGKGTSCTLLTASSTTETTVHFDPPYALTGGIAANPGCKAFTYAQIRHASGSLQPGFLRTTDQGASWTQVDGPCNRADTRFAVTGRGAVIYAGDSVGNVWKTSNGAGTGLSASVIEDLSVISVTASTRATICDSSSGVLLLRYSGCDSVTLSAVSFDNDSLHELSSLTQGTQELNDGVRDSVVFQFAPRSARSWTAHVHISIRQPDGYIEDTVFNVLLIGSRPDAGSVEFVGNTTKPASLNFDSVSLCSFDARSFTIASTSCYGVHVTNVTVTGPFRLRSSFSPFILTSDAERSFLIEYAPTATGPQSGMLVLRHEQGFDTLRLFGAGFAPNAKLSFSNPAISAQACDSTFLSFKLKNLTCAAIHLLTFNGASRVSPAIITDSLAAGSDGSLAITLSSGVVGSGSDTLHLRYEQGGETFDTVVVVSWSVNVGSPVLALDSSSIDFGLVSACGTGVIDSVRISNIGCGDMIESAALDDATQGFQIVRVPSTVGGKSSDIIVIRFTPVAAGVTNRAKLLVHTNAGDRTIALQASTSKAAGELSISASLIPSILSCEVSPFQVTIVNALCDSVYLVSEELANGVHSDFAIENTVVQPLARDQSIQLSLLFTPQDTLVRKDKLILHFLRADGSAFDTAINLTAVAMPPTRIVISIPRLTLSTTAESFISFPVYALTTSSVPIRSADVTIALNTDLITPIGIEPGQGLFGNASPSLSTYRDSVRISFQIPSEVTVTPVLLFVVRCQTYVARVLNTDIGIAGSQFRDNGGASACTPSSVADSTAQFTLDTRCGDITISRTMFLGAVTIEDISPNPTTGHLILQLRKPASQTGEVAVEVLNANGNLEQAVPVTLDGHSTTENVTMSLSGPSGIRYVRLRSRDMVSPARAIEIVR